MFARFRERSHDLEHIDIGDYTPEEYEGCIVELQRVNQWLGDARALRLSLLAKIAQSDLRSFSVLDVAAGSGELLRVAAAWTKRNKFNGSFTALELNARSAKAVLEKSSGRREIVSVLGDALRLPFAAGSFDYSICSLFTHHLDDREVVQALREMDRVARRGIFIIDLHRHPIAYYLYLTVGKLFLHNRLLREDGALSILKSFRPQELISLAARAGLEDVHLDRRFPYRLVLSARAKGVGTSGGQSEGINHPPPVAVPADHMDQAENVGLAR
ncbi:MAG: methyltransferase domain-containing protein [Pyrinomonadaceae bacterium]|nr:methyltransferase domain-containing protein [Pyrinomonadaceae bacterium]